MDETTGDIRQTAGQWYALKLAKGETPLQVVGGEWDGFLYFPIELDGVVYWLAERGLITPPSQGESSVAE